MKYTYKLTFPTFTKWRPSYSAQMEVVKTLRNLCSELSAQEAQDMVDEGGEYLVDIGGDRADAGLVLTGLRILRDYGVIFDHTAHSDEPEPDIQRTVKTDTLDDLRTVAIAALDRGEHDIAIALIELIKKNS